MLEYFAYLFIVIVLACIGVLIAFQKFDSEQEDVE